MKINVVITDKFYGVGVDSSLLTSVGNSLVRAGSGVALFFCGHSILPNWGNSFGRVFTVLC